MILILQYHIEELKSMSFNLILVVFYLIIASSLSYYLKKLTALGTISALFIGLIVYLGTSFIGLLLLVLFFVLSTIATKWKATKKKANKHYENQGNGRTAQQVIANGGVPAILSFLAILYPLHTCILQVLLAGSLSAALADTLSSELGIIYGSNYYEILTFKKVLPGPDGIISLEGLLIGLAGSLLLGVVFCLLVGNFNFLLTIILSGTVGNLIDSLLGATFERKGLIGNNVVNFINTLTGAIVCFILVK
jgi:uncharacterized protein (TIGR00297 family)